MTSYRPSQKLWLAEDDEITIKYKNILFLVHADTLRLMEDKLNF